MFQAQTTFEELPGGLKQLLIQHEVLRGITPGMLVHWFSKLLFTDITINGHAYLAYRVWHPVDHVAVTVLKPSSTGGKGFVRGATIRIQECFGGNQDYTIDNSVFVEKMDEYGVSLRITVMNIEMMRLEHRFIECDQGTHYLSQLRLGTMAPGFSRLAKFFMPKLMPDDKARAWFKHNVEEVGNFEFFLPEACERDPGFK